MSEVVLVSIPNIMASSSRSVTPTKLVVVTLGISLNWGSISLSGVVIDLLTISLGVHIGLVAISLGRMSVNNKTMGVGLVVVILSMIEFILGLLGHQPSGSRMKRMPSRSDIQQLTISIGISMSEVILVSIANIVASSGQQ